MQRVSSVWGPVAFLLPFIALSFANQIPVLTRCCDMVDNTCGPACSFSHTLKEELPVGTPLLNMTATDPDAGTTITYSVTGDANAKSLFEFTRHDATTSVLKIRNKVDLEGNTPGFVSASLEFSDGVNSPIKVNVLFNIQDINDNAPLLMNQPYRCSAKENQPKVNCTGFEVWDKDKDSSRPTVTVTGNNFPASMYKIIFLGPASNSRGVGSTWLFSVEIQKPLDYEKERIFQLTITAKDAINTNTADFSLTVTDDSDQQPVFTKQPYDRKINENSPVGTKIVQIFAQDGDRGINNPIVYSFESGNKFESYFAINNETGEITVAKPIDRENADVVGVNGFIELTVKAAEVSTPPQAASISESKVVVHLTVLDLNDYTPRFSAQKYSGTIRENTQKNVAVLLTPEISCQDLDSGQNGVFNLTVMEGSKVSEVFNIDPVRVVQKASVRLRVQKPSAIDFELSKKTFSLEVIAQEETEPFRKSNASVTLQVVDMNDNFPEFNQTLYTFYVPENSPMDTLVGQVIATDRDNGSYGSVSYSFTGTPVSKFKIDPNSGEIRVAVAADRDSTLLDRDAFATASFSMNVRAEDGGKQAAVAQVIVHLTDENDNSPIFQPSKTYFGTILEESKTFSRQVRVLAIDSDKAPANNVTYAITGGNHGNHFNIDPISGLIGVATVVDLENLPPEQNNSNTFKLTVQAKDQGTPPKTSEAYVVIQVEDINDNKPVFRNISYAVSIPETTPYDTPVFQVSATDADRAGPVIYRISEGGADQFTIDGVNGTIKVFTRSNLLPKLYKLVVLGIDRGAPSRSSEVTVSINVTDVNEKAPYFPASSYTVVVQENNSPNSAVAKYPAKDDDQNANLVYSIKKNEMAAFLGSQRLPAADYENLFTVTNQGDIIALKKLDRETMDNVRIPILVNDTNAETATPVQTASTTISLIIEDVNDESPQFQFPDNATSFSLKVLESLTPPADTSLTVLAKDGDKNDVVRYALSDSSGHFKIDPRSGVVSLKKALDFETTKSLSMEVTAIDSVNHTAKANINVTVIDVNDNNPVFTTFNSPVQVSEGEPVGFVFTTVKATDADSGEFGSVGYFLTSDGGGRFAINQTTGELSLKKSLDRDVTGGSSFRLGVEARDNIHGTYQGKESRLMEVTVTDVNDNDPVFAQPSYNITKQENLGAGQKIDEIAATDKDEGNNAKIVFRLEALPSGSATALTLMTVSTVANRAILTTAKALKNAVGCHTAVLVAEDQGNPKRKGTTQVQLCVLDVNDVPPKFVVPAGAVEVLNLVENKPNVPLITVQATDADQGRNGQVRYKLGSSNGDHVNFTVDPVSGVLTNTAPMDREKQSLYKFSVYAYDLGETSLTSSAAIHVYILDINEHPPAFNAEHKEQQLVVAENSQPDVTFPDGTRRRYVGQIAGAVDKDSGNNSQICYFIVSDLHRELFYMEKTSGKLYVNSVLDRETTAAYVLTIKAVGPLPCKTNDYVWQPKAPNRRRLLFLTNEIPYSATDPTLLRLTVKVGDKNDNPPKFDRSGFFNGVNKDSPPLTEIINFKSHVIDKDAGNNSLLVFNIVGAIDVTQPLKDQLAEKGLTNVLTLGATSGVLATGPRIYFQENWRGYFTMRVRVFDGAFEAFTNVTIYLLSQSQRVVVVFRDSPTNVGKSKLTFANYLSQITGLKVNVDSILTHKKSDGSADSRKTDMYIHAYDPVTNKIISASDLIKLLDSKWESLKTLYNQYNVLSVNAVQTTTPPPNLEYIYRLALILVSCIVGMIIIITCLSLWCCRSMYRRKLKAAQAPSYGHGPLYDYPNQVPGTNMHANEGSNPIWMHQYNNLGASVYADVDTPSDRDRDSLDENALTTKRPFKDVDEQEVVLDLPAETDTDAALPNGGPGVDHANLDAVLSSRAANNQTPRRMALNGGMMTNATAI